MPCFTVITIELQSPVVLRILRQQFESAIGIRILHY